MKNIVSKYRILLTCFMLVVVSITAHAQNETLGGATILAVGKPDSGLVAVYAEPIKNTLMLLDGNPYTPIRTPFYLPVGQHIVTAWSPNHVMVTDTFYVKQTGLTTMIVRLPYLADY
ncbi:MAG: hypothetical protein ACRCYO_09560, partial [Bacteroidia bacterium]